MRIPKLLTEENNSAAPLCMFLIRVMTGTVFLVAGAQKFLYPDRMGAGRFAEIGIPLPGLMGPFVGFVELLCGTLLVLGLLTRLAAVPTLTIMIVAILTTKLPILADPEQNIWAFLHAMRLDWAMLITSVVLIIGGGGLLSFDRKMSRRRR